MKLSILFPFILPIFFIIIFGCADSKDLESVEIVAKSENSSDDSETDLFVCESTASGGDGYRMFKAVGRYSDDSTTTLTDDITWSSDASNDSILSDDIPGLVYCSTAWGVLGIKVTYSPNATDSSSTSDTDSNEHTDSALVRAQ